ncbi:MAG: hypothetical protein KF760_20300 [Candidatus Eremiobacteraeota bacterium]|nr:hypothetical protein [Candidatus Eremiobacteraeota bacterium]MCW5868139.1 hypothetical protein [Candidatus Eremiobacteraeota bacterium]
MSVHSADDPSFRVGAEQNDALSVMTRLRASQAFESNEPAELDGAVEELIDKNLDHEKPDWSEVTRKVMRGVVESIADQDDADWAIRRASHRAVLAVAKRWGNIVMAGKATVVATQEAACRAGFDSIRAAQQAGLGAIEGVLQVGPVAYPVLQREINPIVEDFQGVIEQERRSGEWMLRSLERSSIPLPVMPVEEEPSLSLDLAAEDYAAVAEVAEEAAVVAEEEEELGPPPDFFKAVAAATAAPPAKLGLVQRVVRWFSGLFKKDKKVA